ncbi:hypothetical protein MPF19_04550 [Polaribacter sp. Z014]|uniref:hypothetical protein n=1 Tax=Polaribacter sp. Z014 TaxID=2927126 RepID=UPI0020211951|nr:hypothetical protein [Polaribacter sp. Z014]MCL7762675.1 hypothetical protein [Polaribacter sp. Z014]
MKIKTSTLIIIFLILLTSCSSDKLTTSKAESLFIACQAGENLIKTNTSSFGILERSDSFKKKNGNFIASYKKLEKEGLYTVGELQRIKRNYTMRDRYKVDLTPKAKEFLISAREKYNGEILGKFRICEYTFGSIEEIHEIPEKNIADVRVKLIRIKETPFFREAHEKLNPKEIFKQVKYKKTNDGWKLCN